MAKIITNKEESCAGECNCNHDIKFDEETGCYSYQMNKRQEKKQ